MAYTNPTAGQTLSAMSHLLHHQVFDVDESAPADSFNIDEEGNAIYANRSSFWATQSSAQTIPDEVATKVEFDTVQSNIGSDYSSANHRYTADATAVYLFSVSVSFSTTTGSAIHISLYKNGSSLQKARLSKSENATGAAVVFVVPLTKNDYIEAYVLQNAGADRTTNADGTFFMGVKLI